MEKTYALVTIYHPDAACAENVLQMAAQVDRIYLCDNSPERHDGLFSGLNNAVYLFFGENKGLSAAFNQVFLRCAEDFSPRDFIIYFDQDSTPPQGHIARLKERFRALEEAGFHLGCLGPVYYNPNTERLKLPRVRRKISGNVYAVESVITSSMLTRYHALRDISFWNESVFLDMADWDICWRMRAKGYLCCADTEIVLHHRLGENVKAEGKEASRRKRMVREYYQAREARYLLRQPYTPFRFRLKFIRMLTVEKWRRLATFGDREARAALYRQARQDAKNGVKGAYREKKEEGSS